MRRFFLILITLLSYAQALDVREDFSSECERHTWSFQTKSGLIESDGYNIILSKECFLPIGKWEEGSYIGDIEVMAPLILTPYQTKAGAFEKLCEAGLIDKNSDDNEGDCPIR